MATCTDIDAALARLEAKIDAIPKVDEQSIIQKASSHAQSILKPEIAQVGVVAGGAVIAANQAGSAASIARELADDALSIGKNALGQIGKVAGGLADLVGRFSGLFGIVLNLLSTIAIVYVLGSRIDSLEKDIGVLRQIIEADAALARKAIDASNEAIARSNAAIAKADLAISNANIAINKANDAIDKSNRAAMKADAAAKEANTATAKANESLEQSKLASTKASNALDKANIANSTAIKANATAEDASFKADRVAGELPGMKAETARAHALIQETRDAIIRVIQPIKQDIYTLAQGLISLKGNVAAIVQEYFGLHENQEAKINATNRKIASIDETANSASRVANQALREVNGANRKADLAQGTANQVSAQVPPLRLLSERAYADALKAYNKVQTDVPPVVSGIEQVRRIGEGIQQQFKNNANNIQEQFKGINSTIQSHLAQPSQAISNQQQIVNQQIQNITTTINNRLATPLDPAINNRITALEKSVMNPADSATLKRIESKLATIPTTKVPTIEQIKGTVDTSNRTNVLPRLINPAQVKTAAKEATCEEAQPSGCIGSPLSGLGDLISNLIGDNLSNLISGNTPADDQLNNILNNILNRLNALETTQTTGGTPEQSTAIIEKLNKLGEIIGITEYPASLPASLITTDEPAAANISISNLTQLLGRFIQYYDETQGQWEQPIEIKDSDPSTPGDQTTKIKLPNLSEAIAEIYILLFQSYINSETSLNIQTRTLVETGTDKQQNFITYKLLQSLTDWVGFKQKDTQVEMPLTFTLNKTRYDEILQESKVKVGCVEFDEKFGLEADLMRFRKAASILDSVYFKKMNPTGDIKKQVLDYLLNSSRSVDKVNKNDADEDFDAFLKEVETGFSTTPGITDATEPYGRPFEQRPRIRDLTNYKPPTEE